MANSPSAALLRHGNSAEPMLVACLWSHWTGAGQPELLSFAAITDEPPAEVAAAGHNRCIVPIRPEQVDAWLSPDRGDHAALQAILGGPCRECCRGLKRRALQRGGPYKA